MSIVTGFSCFYLYEHDCVFVFGNDIDFTHLVSVILLNDFVSLFFEKLYRDGFTLFAVFLPFQRHTTTVS